MLAVTRGDRGEEKLVMILISVKTNNRFKFASVRQTIRYILQSRTSATLNEVAISSGIMANPSDYVFTCEHIL